jgi:VWFA-related protein
MVRMRNWGWALAVGLLHGQEVYKFESNVAQVHVDVEVLSGGRAVRGLKANDFRVLDNGDEQKVVDVTEAGQGLDVILLFDVSGSMKLAVERAASGIKRAVATLRPGDRVAVMTFASRTKLLLPFESDMEKVRIAVEEKVPRSGFGGWTYIFDAVNDAAAYHRQDGKGGRRRAIVMVTDNIGQKHKVVEKGALSSLWEADAVLAGVIVQNPLEAQRAMMVVGIDRLAEETGGQAVPARDPGDGLATMFERMRGRYTLYYSMPSGVPGQKRTVQVGLQGDGAEKYPDAAVYARKGYYVPGGPNNPGYETKPSSTRMKGVNK